MREKGNLIRSTAKGADAHEISRPPSPPNSASKNHRVASQAEPVDCYALPSERKIIHLVNSFFSSTGLLFPYIYKKHVLDGLVGMKNTQLYEVRRSWLCLLNTIMAFATCVTSAPQDRKADSVAQADVFLQRAIKLLPNIALKAGNLEACEYLLPNERLHVWH